MSSGTSAVTSTTTTSSSSSSISSPSGAPGARYVRLRLLSGGTYTTGAGTDWSVQFDGAAERALPTFAGEMQTNPTTNGQCADFGVYADAPYDASAYVVASVGAPVQVVVNGGIVSELTTEGETSITFVSGYNVVRFIRSVGPLTVYARFYENIFARWISLYTPNSDPFTGASTGAVGMGAEAVSAGGSIA